MKNKYLSYLKNGTLASVAMVAAGMGASELAKHITENGKVIGTIATLSSYLASWAVFLPLQAYDNRDVYRRTDGKFDRKQFLLDNLKFGVGLLALDGAYLLGRPLVQDAFIDSGFSPSHSSLLTDAMFIPAYFAASIPLAKVSGVLKTNKSSLEEKLEEEHSPDQ